MKKQNFSLREYDIAYSCFLFCGIVALLNSTLSYIPMDSGIAGGLGFLVFIPLFIATLAAMVIAIGYTIKLYHHWPLIILSILSVIFVAEVFTEYGPVMFYNIVLIVYAVSTTLISLTWFFIYRHKNRN